MTELKLKHGKNLAVEDRIKTIHKTECTIQYRLVHFVNLQDWYARELQIVLNYKEWRKFENVIKKAKDACKNSDFNTLDHFVDADKMVQIGSGAERKQKDYKLTRYACYLIAQNGDC